MLHFEILSTAVHDYMNVFLVVYVNFLIFFLLISSSLIEEGGIGNSMEVLSGNRFDVL